MPTKYGGPDVPDLKPETISILLAGWNAPTPPGGAGPVGFGGGLLTVYDADGPAQLWRQHATYLRDVARRWGWTPEYELDGVPMFYGEFLAAGGRED